MSGNYSQYDPTYLFKEWIQKSGRAQTEFIKNFGSLMNNQTSQTFNPLDALKTMSDATRNNQSNLVENVTNLQNKSMDVMFNLGQMLPSFLNWGAYKTTVGSGGRISIPEAERNALGLGEGDLVQVIILPIGKKSGKTEVKQ